MKFEKSLLQKATPLLIAAIATGVWAEDMDVVDAPTIGAILDEAFVRSDTLVVPLRINVPVEGTYVLSAPAERALTVSLDGEAVLSVRPEASMSAEPLKAFTSLTAGVHLIEVTGASIAMDDVAAIVLYQLGAPPASLVANGQVLTPEQSGELLAELQVLRPSTAAPDGLGAASQANVGRKPFLIGGGSSESTQVASTAAGSVTSPAVSSRGVQSNGGSTGQIISGATQASTASAARGNSASSGGVSTVRTGAVAANTGGGAPVVVPSPPAGTPGTPVAVPNPPAGAPVAVPNPPAAAPVIPVVSSPLTPPSDVPITQAVQLTAAGGEQGIVPNTGATLFGAVQSSASFDIVNVQLSSGRSTTVDVGPMTGQFAVRVFEEDFANDAGLTVTLTGASTVNDQVQAQPVSYYITGMPANDGLSQALGRLTFGPTPDLYTRVRAMGFQAFVEEQLNPASITNTGPTIADPEAMINASGLTPLGQSLRRFDLAHQLYSDRQFQTVMAAFWTNHFHAVDKRNYIYADLLEDRRFYLENAFGTFEDLLRYSAHSSVMLIYLDNNDSRVGNINENYGREFLELHSVGTNAGYGPEDIIAVSRVFTGWSARRVQSNPIRLYDFVFVADRHDTDDKFIPFLDLTIPGRSGAVGENEGQELITIVSNHPSTKSFICGKIVQLLVADMPPQNFIDNCVAAWGDGGNIQAMLRAILLDPEYITNPALQRNKAKTPLEYLASVVRALGARPNGPSLGEAHVFLRDIERGGNAAGYNTLGHPTPDGLPEVAQRWGESDSMVARSRYATGIVERQQQKNIDFMQLITDAGLETAEEAAAYMLTIATADRFRRAEFEAIVAELKGADGIFEPRMRNESRAFERAIGLLVMLPSFQLQ